MWHFWTTVCWPVRQRTRSLRFVIIRRGSLPSLSRCMRAGCRPAALTGGCADSSRNGSGLISRCMVEFWHQVQDMAQRGAPCSPGQLLRWRSRDTRGGKTSLPGDWVHFTEGKTGHQPHLLSTCPRKKPNNWLAPSLHSLWLNEPALQGLQVCLYYRMEGHFLSRFQETAARTIIGWRPPAATLWELL